MSDVQQIELVNGFRVAGVHAGLKADDALDFTLIVSDFPCTAAGVFTTNQVKAAPVLVDMEKLAQNSTSVRAVAVNTKCANACTGQRGIDDARDMARLTAERLGVSEDSVLVMSTGVIGTQLPMDKIARGVDLAAAALGGDWLSAAQGIMTTDTRPKLVQFAFPLNGREAHLTGIAKGAGMIAPNMATMLSVIVTDAAISQPELDRILRKVNETTFNAIAVDGDTSTNDTVLVLANGASGAVCDGAAALEQFEIMLGAACEMLAREVVRDGEGATKFIELRVSGTKSRADARRIANTIATSPLVKTAFYGADANWGRILAAAGRAGVELDAGRLSLKIAPLKGGDAVQLIARGEPTGYSEEAASAIMREKDILVELDCGLADGNGVKVWTCDLSHDYVSINGHYRS
jgi:glutamate N-acetyltransferase/amino-acid N-acetyltransferase